MKPNMFFSRRYVWVPTIWTVSIVFITTIGLAFYTFKNAAYFLAENSPVDSSILVVEGWLAEAELEQALVEFNEGDYNLMVTTGGPITTYKAEYSTYAERAKAAFLDMGVKPSQLLVVPTLASAQNRTYLSAVMVRNELLEMKPKLHAINVFSGVVHSRRTHLLYKIAFKETGVEIGILAADSKWFSLAFWWESSNGVKSVLTELIGWLWVKCCFYPAEQGSHAELWGA